MNQRIYFVLTLAICLVLVFSSCAESIVADPPLNDYDEPTDIAAAANGGQSVVDNDALATDTLSNTPETPNTPDVPETPEVPVTPEVPDEPDEPEDNSLQLSPSDPGYLEEKYAHKEMLAELTALVEGGALPWLIDEYFVARESEFLQRENALRLYPWEQREEYGYWYSDDIMDMEDIRVDGITDRIEKNWGNIKIVDADARYLIKSCTVEENGDIHVVAYEWTYFWYQCEGYTQLDESGFGTEHTLIVKVTEDGLELSEDLYDEWDMTGAGTLPPHPGNP